MDTLIELYDERAIENVIGPETFAPKRVIYLCPAEVAENRNLQNILRRFFQSRGMNLSIQFVASSMYKADHIFKQLQGIAALHPDCVVDITGGTDAALFAAGMFCQESETPAFTYSRKKNSFYNICYAEFAEGKKCQLEYRVEDFFRMTGGELRKGRVDNQKLSRYMDSFDAFFQVFLKYRREWTDQITFLQRISQNPESDYLRVQGSRLQKGSKGSRISGNPELLMDLQGIGYLTDVTVGEEQVSFRFRDGQIRAWLRDVGSVLELYLYKACRDTGIFGDVISSAIVDWDGTVGHDSVSNEIDVVATRGVVPLFISCKACDVKTEALNELAILRDRFGGKGAKSIIATTENCNAAARHRAAQLGIAVLDLEELRSGQAAERIKVVMKVRDSL